MYQPLTWDTCLQSQHSSGNNWWLQLFHSGWGNLYQEKGVLSFVILCIGCAVDWGGGGAIAQDEKDIWPEMAVPRTMVLSWMLLLSLSNQSPTLLTVMGSIKLWHFDPGECINTTADWVAGKAMKVIETLSLSATLCFLKLDGLAWADKLEDAWWNWPMSQWMRRVWLEA